MTTSFSFDALCVDSRKRSTQRERSTVKERCMVILSRSERNLPGC